MTNNHRIRKVGSRTIMPDYEKKSMAPIRRKLIVRPIMPSGNAQLAADQRETHRILDNRIASKTRSLYDAKTSIYLEWIKSRNTDTMNDPDLAIGDLDASLIPSPDDENYILNELTPM
jgi:hypothetical protein